MSVQALPIARPRRRYGWWIGGGIAATLLALTVVGVIYLAQPVKFVMGFMQGNPQLPGFQTTIVSEGTVGPLWNRFVDLKGPGQTMHMVFVKREPSPMPFVMPALLIVGDPVPVSLHQTGDNAFEIVLSAPLADGRTSVPVTLDANGVVKEFESFEHGRPMNGKAPFGM